MSLAGPSSEPPTSSGSPAANEKPKPKRTCGTPGCELPDFHTGPCSSVEVGRRRVAPKPHAADVLRPPSRVGMVASGKQLAARKVPSGKVAVAPRKQQLPSQRTPEEQAARKRARAAAPSGLPSQPPRYHPQLWSGGGGGGGGGAHTERKAVPVGASHQAELPPLLVDSVEPPPAAPPRCWCAAPAMWARRRWWCAADACEYEAEPPPRVAPSSRPSASPSPSPNPSSSPSPNPSSNPSSSPSPSPSPSPNPSSNPSPNSSPNSRPQPQPQIQLQLEPYPQLQP